MTIPIPKRTNKQLQGEFYPLQREELIKLREVKLINNAAYVHLALRYENPFCDRPVQIIPKEFALRWKMPESSVYKAIAKLKELGILNIKSGKLVIDWVKPETQTPEESQAQAIAVNSNSVPEPDSDELCSSDSLRLASLSRDSHIEQKIIRSDNSFSHSAKDYPIRENSEPKALVDIHSDTPQTLHNFQTSQTQAREEKNSAQEKVQNIVQKTTQDESDRKDIADDVVQEKTQIISPSTQRAVAKKSAEKDSSIPDGLVGKLEELGIKLDYKVRSAIASHHISQVYGACTHCENTFSSINDVRAVFLHQLPKQPVEKLGSRYSDELLESVKAQNEAIEAERNDPEYFEKSKSMFAEARAKLERKCNES